MTTDILSRIADYKRVDVAARKSQMTTSSLEKQAELMKTNQAIEMAEANFPFSKATHT